MKNVTGSKVEILQHCGWFARDDVSYAEPARGAAAGRGVDIHEAIEKNSLDGVAFEDLAIVERGRAYVRKLRERGFKVELEVAFAFDVTNGETRRLPSFGHRDYSDAKPTEIPFTVDYIAHRDAATETESEVGDWKTGYGAHVTPAAENWQMGIASIAMRRDVNHVRIHYLDSGFVDAHTFSSFELELLSRKIREAVERIPGSQPSPGDHCRYCPGRLGCPAVQGALVALAPQLQQKVNWSLERVSLENDALMAMHLPALKAAVEAIEKALKGRCGDGLDLPNGKVWRPVLQRRTGLDTEKVKLALGARYDEFTKVSEYEVFRQVKK